MHTLSIEQLSKVELPEECPVNLDHLMVHVRSCYEAIENDDMGQAVHDIDISDTILAKLIMIARNSGQDTGPKYAEDRVGDMGREIEHA